MGDGGCAKTSASKLRASCVGYHRGYRAPFYRGIALTANPFRQRHTGLGGGQSPSSRSPTESLRLIAMACLTVLAWRDSTSKTPKLIVT